ADRADIARTRCSVAVFCTELREDARDCFGRTREMKWITRERPKVGRLGCAWLIRRFVDPEAEFYFVAGRDVRAEAERLGATPFHADGAELSRQGDVSSVEVVIRHYGLESDPALVLLGRIVNVADIKQSRYDQPEGAGLRAITDGLQLCYANDHALNEAGE